MQENNKKNEDYKKFKKIVNMFYNEEIQILNDQEEINEKDKGSMEITPRILFDKFSGNMKVEFKVGKSKKYKIKDVTEFYNRMQNNEFYRYGDKVKFIHKKEIFTSKSQKILEFIMKYAETIKLANTNIYNNYQYTGAVLDASRIAIGRNGLDDLFEIEKGDTIEFQIDGKVQEIQLLDENPQIEFVLTKSNENDEYTIKPNVEMFKVRIIKGKDYKYVLKRNKLYRCSKDFEKANLKLLETLKQEYITELTFKEEGLKDLFSIIYPRLKKAINIEGIDAETIIKYKPKDLIIKVFLDYNEKEYLTADVRFCYGKQEINPLNESEKTNFPRNIIKETQALNMFKKTGFMFDSKNLRFILPDNDKIYSFLTEEVEQYIQKFEILATDKFKAKPIKQPKIGNINVRIEANLLKIDLNEINISIEEIKSVLEHYKEKKKYYRLKSGEFIDLQNNTEINFLEKLWTGLDVSFKQIQEGNIEVPAYRALYFNQLLSNIKDTKINKNQEYKKLITNLNQEEVEDIIIPEELDKELRYYQKIGFEWLKEIDKYKFGGILADDMGLGKTIQILALIVDYIKNFDENPNVIKGQETFAPKQRRASLVVSPSSLALNWKNEVEKFASSLKTLVIKGDAAQRRELIKQLDNYDLVITSYDLLKRDIEIYKEMDYNFRFMIADEAQYLKNSSTQNARAIKKIKADTKYALTGTPIENSLAELWSIFDFIMPGYLYDYRKFKREFENIIVKDNDQKTMEKLKMLIQPFILRRIKQEVLTELPEKTVTVLNNEMQDEQYKVYESYLARAKKEIAETIKFDDSKNNQMKILAALTRLRQICCHPSLFIDNYKSESSKLEQCIEVVTEAINGGHKILLFSSYTSMFKIIEERLKEEKIKYFKLTGSTKVDERLELVDEFNENPDVKVFLISLKAGGTGLNLTGADVVIHYDPWWNISAENQATDRVYRIGQKNNVQVYKLITKNTIEEKIYDLQQKKAKLIDNMLDTQTVFVNKLSKEEILNLFE